MKSRFYYSLAVLALVWPAPGQSPPAAKITALALVREGDKFVAPQAKDRITQIRSEQSAVGLAPDVWYVDYYDPTSTFKMTEVKFVAGKMTEIKRPKHLLDPFSGNKQLEWKRLKIDSDHALAIALQEPSLKKLDLQAAQFWLEQTSRGPAWKIRFWTARLGQPGQLSEIGDVYIASKTGEVLKTDFHF